jgi:hypothetical protein
MKSRIYILSALIILVLLLTTCSKDDGVCISSTGKVISQERPAESFQSVEVFDNINLFLTQDPYLTKITVEAGENLLDGITTEIDSGKLIVRNENSCNWLRSFDVPVNVYLTFPLLYTIIFQAAGNITCTNDWKNESVYLDVVEGAGKIDLKLDVYRSFFIVKYGTTAINLSGNSEVTTIISSGFGPFHAEDLVSKFTYVSSYSSNDVFVYSSADLAVEIGNIGNVYYTGNPVRIYTTILSDGRLIEL